MIGTTQRMRTWLEDETLPKIIGTAGETGPV